MVVFILHHYKEKKLNILRTRTAQGPDASSWNRTNDVERHQIFLIFFLTDILEREIRPSKHDGKIIATLAVGGVKEHAN